MDHQAFVGARFHAETPLEIQRVGGHFLGDAVGGTFFAAIVGLTGPTDFPDSSELTTPDVLGTTVLAWPGPVSTEVYANLSLAVQEGWYAIVFGSGHFGAEGVGIAFGNGQDFLPASYIQREPNIEGNHWGNLMDLGTGGYHFVVEGRAVPEPSDLSLGKIASGLFLGCASIRSRRRRLRFRTQS